ncbi:MAG: hypothetical protein ACREQB_10390 [Candidatus Binataceae bacterium]
MALARTPANPSTTLPIAVAVLARFFGLARHFVPLPARTMFLAWYVKDRDALWQPEAICVMVVDLTVVFLTGRVRLGLTWSREIA